MRNPASVYATVLGEFVREVRTDRRLSVRALAALAPGCSHSTIVRLENGKPVNFAHLVSVLRALGFSLAVVGGIRPPVERVGR